ncbi:phage terminase large subunit [Novosphingobium flavum]|uniref:Phage terminase large subunit n=1 Tax=Novosphingobium flavum TaxID=1778672 RepID=A0A7X1KN05_9SPHN|nr:phage terminase large subunit [Novosphingobium flavum]MBC2667199.1 phage terminase large subunit [Novosphingobium flavum]
MIERGLPPGLADRFSDPVAVHNWLLVHDFAYFLRKAFAFVNGGEVMVWNWHFDAIVHQLDRVRAGDNRRLLITLPPRNGKSIAISVAWVAWMLGKNPALNFVCVSYSNELSGKLARDCLSVMQSAWYREAFPGTVIAQKRSANYDFETTRRGGRLSTSVGGTLTGRGGDIIIMDDVIKPEEANSETTRTFVNGWFRSTLSSRLDDKSRGTMLCVMQRLHEDDLAGMLLESGGWEHLTLAAIAEVDMTIPLTRRRVHRRKAGELLHPAREPLPVLMELKAAMGSYAFAAQYQQDPVPALGNVIRGEWFRTFATAGFARFPGTVIQSWDTASKDNPHNDWSVCVTALVRGNDVYILDLFRGRLQLPDLTRTAISLAREHRADVLLIEDQASGTQLIQNLRHDDPPGVPSPVGRRPETDKQSRALGVSAMIEAGRVHVPEDAPWLAEFIREVSAFPNGRHDDQVDALSQLLGWVRQHGAWWNSPPAAPEEIGIGYGFRYYGDERDEEDDEAWYNVNEDDDPGLY